MSIFVGNLSYEISQEDLVDVFKEYGKVQRVHIPVDKDTQRKRGFAFVEMESKPRKLPQLRHWMVLNGWGDQLKLTRPASVKSARPSMVVVVTEKNAIKLFLRIIVGGG